MRRGGSRGEGGCQCERGGDAERHGCAHVVVLSDVGRLSGCQWENEWENEWENVSSAVRPTTPVARILPHAFCRGRLERRRPAPICCRTEPRPPRVGICRRPERTRVGKGKDV